MNIASVLIFVYMRLISDISNIRCEIIKSHEVKDANVRRHKCLIWISGGDIH